MAESEHDDLADALARMADGDVAPAHHGTPEHEPEVAPPPPVRAVRPVTKRPAAVKPAAASPKPPAPAPAVPSPAVRPPAVRPVAPVRPRPTAPTLGASTEAPQQAPVATPVLRKPRPSAPTTRAVPAPTERPGEIDSGQSTGPSADDGQVIDDDDSVIVPAPDPSVFEHRSQTAADARAKIARQKNLNFRRTLIPILLTFGLLLIGFASLKFVSNSDSLLTDLPIWVPILLVIFAIMLLALAAVNMISVKKQMDAKS